MGTLSGSLEGQRGRTQASTSAILYRNNDNITVVETATVHDASSKRVSANSLGNRRWYGSHGGNGVVFAVKKF